MGCCFHFLVFSSDMDFIAHRLYAYERIFQVSGEREKRMRKFFIDKFTSYSLFSPISHCSLSLLFFYVVCWLGVPVIKFIFHVFICVCLCGLCFVWYLSFLWLCVRRIWFLFRCMLPCDATFLFWPLYRISVSLPTINMCT